MAALDCIRRARGGDCAPRPGCDEPESRSSPRDLRRTRFTTLVRRAQLAQRDVATLGPSVGPDRAFDRKGVREPLNNRLSHARVTLVGCKTWVRCPQNPRPIL